MRSIAVPLELTVRLVADAQYVSDSRSCNDLFRETEPGGLKLLMQSFLSHAPPASAWLREEPFGRGLSLVRRWSCLSSTQ